MLQYLVGFLALFGYGQYNFSTHSSNEALEQAASYARYMVQNGLYGVFATNYAKNSTYAYASQEDFAESYEDNGYPIFLLADISSTANNLLLNSYGSFAISMTNCTMQNYNGMPYDPLACPRLTLMGKFTKQPGPLNMTDPNLLAFIDKHPASSSWIQSGVHQFDLWTFEFDRIYYIGGYGNLHFIGDIPLDTYLNSRPICPP